MGTCVSTPDFRRLLVEVMKDNDSAVSGVDREQPVGRGPWKTQASLEQTLQDREAAVQHLEPVRTARQAHAGCHEAAAGDCNRRWSV